MGRAGFWSRARGSRGAVRLWACAHGSKGLFPTRNIAGYPYNISERMARKFTAAARAQRYGCGGCGIFSPVN